MRKSIFKIIEKFYISVDNQNNKKNLCLIKIKKIK